LKAAFPNDKFSVLSESFSMGNAVKVYYPNSLHPHEVKRAEAIAGTYQEGHFDGMTDCYEYSNCRDDLPQVKYVHVQRVD
jgi:hypothetical protein